MNTVRTRAVEIGSIPALAYKQKLSTGGAGIKIHRLDCDAVAVFTLDKRGGQATAYGKFDSELFPEASVQEAIESTIGLPYSTYTRIVLKIAAQSDAEAQDEGNAEEIIDMLSSKEYNAIIGEYVKENGKLDYTRLNKEFIQFASKSKTVAGLAAKSAGVDEILRFVVKNRAAYLAKEKELLSDAQTTALIEILDDINPRSALKELSSHIKKMLAKK
ncbi:MAG: hypothetical protein LBT55_02225 [Clostridiaceae bacterium]|jgi:hypothetical protein|nr:hypothetical protein [Clostridiaceae bacterium]